MRGSRRAHHEDRVRQYGCAQLGRRAEEEYVARTGARRLAIACRCCSLRGNTGEEAAMPLYLPKHSTPSSRLALCHLWKPYLLAICLLHSMTWKWRRQTQRHWIRQMRAWHNYLTKYINALRLQVSITHGRPANKGQALQQRCGPALEFARRQSASRAVRASKNM